MIQIILIQNFLSHKKLFKHCKLNCDVLVLQVVTKFDHSLTLNLRSASGHNLPGTITVHAEESDSSKMAVEMTLHCLNLENKDLLSKSVCINFLYCKVQ
jgi:hypothetical protein